jgi:hypothetical protein
VRVCVSSKYLGVGLCVGMCAYSSCIRVYVYMYLSGPERQSRTGGYPPVALKPSEVRMSAGGVGGPAQDSPVMMKKAMTVQSSRPQPAAAMAQPGESRQPGLRPLERQPQTHYAMCQYS